jgi:hypothetical protein
MPTEPVDPDEEALYFTSIEDPGPQANQEGEAVSLPIPADWAGSGTPTFAVQGLPPGVSIDANTGIITGTIAAGAPGSYEITVTASDGTTTDTRTFSWTVVPFSFSLDQVPDQSSAEGDPVSLPVPATDRGGGQWLTFSADNLPPGLSINAATGRISGTIDAGAGSALPYLVTVTATDGPYTSRLDIPWQVDAPLSIQPVPAQYNKAGDTVRLGLVAQASPSGGPLVATAAGLPSGLSLDARTGFIAGTLRADAVGMSDVSVTVTDGVVSSHVDFPWFVDPAPDGVTPPPGPARKMQFENRYVMDLGGGTGWLGFFINDSQPEPDGGAYSAWVDRGDGNGWQNLGGLLDIGGGGTGTAVRGTNTRRRAPTRSWSA